MSVICDLIETKKTYKKENPWDNSPFKDLLELTIDKRGELGEEIISNSLKDFIIEDVSNKNIHENKQHYDLKIKNDFTIEVKTAYRDINNCWQHENIYQYNGSDIIIFVDFDYNNFYITFVEVKDIPFKGVRDNQAFGRKHTTLRKNKDDGHKFDFSLTTIKNLKKANYCQEFNENSSYEEINKFLKEKINAII